MAKDGPPPRGVKSSGDVALDARFLNSKAWSLRWSDRKRSSDLARQALKRSQSQAPPDTDGAGLACRTLAWQSNWVGAFDDAQSYCRRAQEALCAEKHPVALGDVLGILGFIHFCRGRRDLAWSVTQEGLALINDLDAVSTRIDLMSTQGAIHRYNGRMFEAYMSLQSARNLSTRGERARVDHNLARCLEHDNNPTRAVGYAMRAVIGARRHGNRVVLPYALEVLGNALGRLKNYDLAMTYLHEGLRIAREDGDNKVRCHLLGQIGCVLHMYGNTEQALRSLSEGLQVAEELDYPILQRTTLRSIAKIEQQRQNHAAAVEAYSKLVDLMEAERS